MGRRTIREILGEPLREGGGGIADVEEDLPPGLTISRINTSPPAGGGPKKLARPTTGTRQGAKEPERQPRTFLPRSPHHGMRKTRNYENSPLLRSVTTMTADAGVPTRILIRPVHVTMQPPMIVRHNKKWTLMGSATKAGREQVQRKHPSTSTDNLLIRLSLKPLLIRKQRWTLEEIRL